MTTMQGGVGADSVNGGGGGYFGGKGGAKGLAAAGGAGFTSPKALDPSVLFAEPLAGKVPRADDPEYDGIAGTAEKSGLVILQFSCDRPKIR